MITKKVYWILLVTGLLVSLITCRAIVKNYNLNIQDTLNRLAENTSSYMWGFDERALTYTLEQVVQQGLFYDITIYDDKGHEYISLDEVEIKKRFIYFLFPIRKYTSKIIYQEQEIGEITAYHKSEVLKSIILDVLLIILFTSLIILLIYSYSSNKLTLKTREELLKREKLASLGSLVAGVSHEINTPLGVSVTASSHLTDIYDKAIEKINKGQFKKEDLVNYFKDVEETSKILNNNLFKASELVKSFKAISINQTSYHLSFFNLLNVINSTILALKHEYKNRNINFEIYVDDNINLNSYSGAISQILTNLIMNSIIHGFKNLDSGLISIKSEVDRENVFITYSDNGNGIDNNIINKIYDPFFTTNRGSGGSGLGMNIVYNLIQDKLNGEIKCSSTSNQGVEFFISIPLTIEKDS